MQRKQASGIDTRGMMPLYLSIYIFLCSCVFPWITIPRLKFARFPATYTLWQLEDCVANLQQAIQMGGVFEMNPISAGKLELLSRLSFGLKAMAVVLMVLMVWTSISSYRKKIKSLPLVRTAFAISMISSILFFAMVGVANVWLNESMGLPNTFSNLTINSCVQLASWQYAQMILSLLMLIFGKKLLDTDSEYKVQTFIGRSQKTDRRIGKRTWTATLLILVAIPLVIWFGIYFLNDRSQLFIAMCIIGLAMIPFAMVFEERKPQAREILLIAVMSAIAVAGRMAFFMVPQFKPVTAIVIIAGVGLGAEAGFLTGAMAGFVSNFFFGQGPWTPWQMFSFGIIGFLAGLLFSKDKKRQLSRANELFHKMCLCIYGGVATFVIYGLMMDMASIVMSSQGINWELIWASILTGIPFNAIHALSTIVFLFFLAVPLERKLDRIKKKYGIMEV